MFGGNKPAFGSTSSTFGSSGTSIFGQNKPAGSSLFGSSTTSNQNTGGIFGQKPAGGGLFGSSQSSSLFGSNTTANTSGSLFGGSGSNKPSLFGSTTNTSNAFGASNTGGSSLFGGTSNTGTSMFGGSMTTNGTTVKFDPPASTDTMMKNGNTQNINTKHMCITAMKAYEGKSLEELRVEDYLANRKTPQVGSTSVGLFGSSTSNTSGGLFGSSTPTKSIFGASNTGSTFGTPATSTQSSLFGNTSNTQQSTSLFGSKPATGGLCGSSTTTNAFGSPSTNTGGSLFGGATQQTSTFGQPSTGGLFGSSTSTFGVPATSQASTGFSFGGNTANTNTTFGQAAAPAAGTGLFGSTAPATSFGGLFGAKPATGGFGFGTTTSTANTGFGTTNTGGGLFGSNTSQKPGGLFGSTTSTTGTGLFGTQPTQPASGGLFGTTQPVQTNSLFGAQPVQQATAIMPTQVPAAAITPIVLGSDVNQLQVQKALIDAQLAASPYGDSPLLKLANKSKKDTDECPNPTSVQRQMKFLASKMAETPQMTINGTLLNSPTLGKAAAPLSVSSLSSVTNKSMNQGRSPVVIKDLAYSPSCAPPTLGKGLRSTAAMNNSTLATSRRLNQSAMNSSIDNVVDAALASGSNLVNSAARKTYIKHLDPTVMNEIFETPGRVQVIDRDHLPGLQDLEVNGSPATHQPQKNFIYTPSEQPAAAAIQREKNLRQNEPPRFNLDASVDESSVQAPASTQPSVKSVQSSPIGKTSAAVSISSPRRSLAPHPGGIILNNDEYFCEPSVTAMREKVIDGYVILDDGLRIGRATYGSVFWPGRIKIQNINIEEIVVFRHKEVTVYPDEASKPQEGEGLNCPAEVTLERVWPIDKESKQDIKEPLRLVEMGWRERLERVTARMGAIFKDYRPATGSWVFRVEHFSKYGLPDEESDEETHPNADLITRVNISMNDSQIQGLVQRQKIVFNSSHNMQVAHLNETELDLRMPHTSDYNKNGLGGGLACPVVMNSLSDSTAEEMDCVPEAKKQKVQQESEDDEDELLGQCQNVLDSMAPMLSLRRPVMLKEPKHILQKHAFTCHELAANSHCARQTGPIDVAAAMGTSAPVRFNSAGFFTRSLLPHRNQIELVKTQYPDDLDPEYLEDMFEHNIRLSNTITRNRSISAKVKHCELENQVSAPRIKPSLDFAEMVDSFLATSQQSGRKKEFEIWELCKALFPSEKTENDVWLWERNRLVGEWIKKVLLSSDHPARKIKFAKGAKGEKTWNAICNGQTNKVVSCGEGFFNFGALLEMRKDSRTRLKIQDQLAFWRRTGQLAQLSDCEIKAYAIMSGQSAITVNDREINVMDGLHWMQALGLHIWFAGEDRCPLEVNIQRFMSDVHAGRTHVPERDVVWELIQLGINEHHPVEKILDAAHAYSEWNIDYHLSWHVWTVLRSAGFSQCDPSCEQRMHIGYSEQLVATELSHLAAFVLSHISNDQCRSAALHDMLDRLAPWASVNDYRKILETIKLPPQWVAAARAIKAKMLGCIDRECELWLEAFNHDFAEKLFVDEIAPTSVAAEDWSRLQHFVNLFEKYREDRSGSEQAPKWSHGTLSYCEYLQLREGKVESDEEIIQLCDTIEARLERSNFRSPIQRMSLGTISRHLMEVRRGLTGKLNTAALHFQSSSQPINLHEQMELTF